MSEFLKPFLDAGLITDSPDDSSRKIVEFLGKFVAQNAGLDKPDDLITPKFMLFRLQESFPIFGLGINDLTGVIAYLHQDSNLPFFDTPTAEGFEEFISYFNERLQKDIEAQENSDDSTFERAIDTVEAADPSHRI